MLYGRKTRFLEVLYYLEMRMSIRKLKKRIDIIESAEVEYEFNVKISN